MSTDRWVGAGLIALSAVAFGAMAIFGKLALAANLQLEMLLALRFVMAGGVMLVLMQLLPNQRWPQGRALLGLVLMGGVGYIGQAWCYFSALQYASAGLTALLLYLFPAIVTVLHAVIERRRLTMLRSLAVAAALLGTAMTVGGQVSGQWLGVVYGVSAALIYSVYILVGERVTRGVAAIPAATVVMLSAGLTASVLAVGSQAPWPESAHGWMVVLAIALVSTVVAIVAFFAGLRRLGAPDASTLSTLEPLATIALAAWVLGEWVTPLQLAGGAIILGAVIVLARWGGETDVPRRVVLQKTPSGAADQRVS